MTQGKGRVILNIHFTVDGKPHGKGRPRFTRNGHAYTDAATKTYEHRIALACKGAMNGAPPSEKGVEVTLSIRVAPPESVSKRKSADMLDGKILPLKKPDIDNVLKAVCDACNGIAYRDDRQVVGIELTKRYAEKSGVDVVIRECECV